MSRKSLTRVFVMLNLAVMLYLLVALWVDGSSITRGYFTDYFCGMIPTALVPINLVVLLIGLYFVRVFRFWVALPIVSLILALCFRDSFLFWLLGGWVPGG